MGVTMTTEMMTNKGIDDLIDGIITDVCPEQINSRQVLMDKLMLRPTKEVIDDNLMDKSLVIKRIDNFVINEKLEMIDSKELPKLKPLKELSELKFGSNLEKGFKDSLSNNRLIDNYEIYRTKKLYHYFQRIKDSQLISKHKPKFVSFGGPVADIMTTIYNTDIDWKISAEMVNDVIYFYKTAHKYIRYDGPTDRDYRRSYCLLNFFQLATNRYDDETDKCEYIKHFAINCCQLGSDNNKLMTLNQLDAIDDNGQSVGLKLVKMIRRYRDRQPFWGKKLLKFWSNGFIQGMNQIVIANIENNYLMGTEISKVSKIPESAASYWSSDRCIVFLKRFLKFMSTNVKEERIVYEFVFNRGEEYVTCYQTNDGKHIVPEDY